MKRYAPLLSVLAIFAGLAAFLVPTIGQVPQTLVVSPPVPAAVPTINKRGTSNVFQLAANTSAAAAGTVFCDDGSGNATTSGCTAGSSITLKTNGTNNGSQSILNLAQGTGITLADNGTGTVTITGTAAGTANPSCTFSGTATGCGTPASIDVSALNASNINQFLVQCFTGASTTQTPVTILTYVYTTGSGIVQTVAPTFASAAAAGYCVANGNGSGGSGGGGSLALVEQHTASNSAELDFTTGITATYDTYQIQFVSLIPVTTNQTLELQFSTDGGSTYDSGTNYTSNNAQVAGSTFIHYNLANTFAECIHDVNNTSGYSTSASMTLFNPLSTSNFKGYWGYGFTRSSDGNFYQNQDAGTYLNTSAVNAFRVFFASGNIASGTVRLYGLAH